jgi:biopolymer transport protein TolR
MAGGIGNYGRGKGRYRPLAEINVTPLVDVMLVLLIVFMVAAPLMTSGVNVDLPKASAAPLSQDSEPVTVSVNAEGKVFLQETEATLPDLVGRLQAATDGKNDRRIYVRGDKGISYGRIMEVMATINQGGFTKVALLAEQAGAPAAAAPASPAAPARGAGAGASPAAAVPATTGARRQGRG